MATQSKKGSLGSVGCGFFLWVIVLAAWGITALIFPKMPGYKEAMERGDVVDGKVLRIETVENVRINERHPRRVIYRYGEEQGEMTMAMSESAKDGQAIKVRVLDGQAYPEDIRPLASPSWLKFVFIGGIVLGAIMIGLGILKLLIIGGVLFAAGRELMKKKSTPPSRPPPLGPQA
jgi:hypothetical protein